MSNYSNGCPRGPDFMPQVPAVGTADNKAGSGRVCCPCVGANICQLANRRSGGIWGTGFPDFCLLRGLLGVYLSFISDSRDSRPSPEAYGAQWPRQ